MVPREEKEEDLNLENLKEENQNVGNLKLVVKEDKFKYKY